MPGSQANVHGAVRLNGYTFSASHDRPRITKTRLSDNVVVGAADYAPQAGLEGRVRSVLLTPDGALWSLINEAASPWAPTPAGAGYAASTIAEVLPGAGDAAPAFSAANKVAVTETIGKATHSLLNAANLVHRDGNLYSAGIGGPHMFGQSNAVRSTLFRIPVSSGVLGAPRVAYHGFDDESFCDILDVGLSGDVAVITLGVFLPLGVRPAGGGDFYYVALRQPLADRPDPSDPARTITGLANTHGEDILSLLGEPWAFVGDGTATGGGYHTVKRGQGCRHYWCPHGTSLPVYGEDALNDLSAPPPPGQVPRPAGLHCGSAGLSAGNAVQAAPAAGQLAAGRAALAKLRRFISLAAERKAAAGRGQ